MILLPYSWVFEFFLFNSCLTLNHRNLSLATNFLFRFDQIIFARTRQRRSSQRHQASQILLLLYPLLLVPSLPPVRLVQLLSLFLSPLLLLSHRLFKILSPPPVLFLLRMKFLSNFLVNFLNWSMRVLKFFTRILLQFAAALSSLRSILTLKNLIFDSLSRKNRLVSTELF